MMKNRLLKRQYAVAVAEREPGKPITEYNYHVLKNGLNYWVADPFPIEKDGELYIFGEVFKYTNNKGCIGYTRLKNGRFTPWKTVIEESYHLSFPNIFICDGEYYMCPEANESESIYLYRCKCFPDKWEKDRVILKGGNYVDTVFFRENNEVFGITYDVKNNNSLRLFLCRERVELSNEIVIGASSEYTRPAGKIFTDEVSGKEILPTQIGIPTYGAGIVLNEFNIDWPRMTLKPVKKLYPRDFSFDNSREYVGIHTINFTENYIIVDLKWYGFNLINILCKITNKIRGTSSNNR